MCKKLKFASSFWGSVIASRRVTTEQVVDFITGTEDELEEADIDLRDIENDRDSDDGDAVVSVPDYSRTRLGINVPFMEALWFADSWCQNHSYMGSLPDYSAVRK